MLLEDAHEREMMLEEAFDFIGIHLKEKKRFHAPG